MSVSPVSLLTMWNDFATKKTVTCRNLLLIMSLDSTQFVSSNFAEFLLDNANNGDEILAVLDDISEVQDTVL